MISKSLLSFDLLRNLQLLSLLQIRPAAVLSAVGTEMKQTLLIFLKSFFLINHLPVGKNCVVIPDLLSE